MVDIFNNMKEKLGMKDQMAYSPDYFLIFTFIMKQGCFSFITSKTSNIWLIATLLNHFKEIFVILQPYAAMSFVIKISLFWQNYIILAKNSGNLRY